MILSLLSLIIFFLRSFYQSQLKISPALTPSQASIKAEINEPIKPIPLKIELDEKKVKLGDKLFHDVRLSHDNTISCATCHKLTAGGTDHLPCSVGIRGTIGHLNAPTVFNSGFNFKQFWDGRAETLEAQIDGPTHNKGEMGSSWSEIIGKLEREPDYVTTFNALYAEGITHHNIKEAIATFERSLYTPNSRFDQFLRGDNVLTSEEKEGYRRFKTLGCISCHQGVNVGGNMFQAFGIMGDYFGQRKKNIVSSDLGRFNVTGDEKDKHVFKVPGLRNVAITAPYFHDGSAQTLEEAIIIMGKYQLGRHLSTEDVTFIVKFLKTLTGEYQGKPL